MPSRAKHGCRYPGCPNLVEPGHSHCELHRKQRQRRYDAQRGSSAQRGYDAQWRKLRKMVLAQHPLCVDPFGIHAERGEVVEATEVDHVVPLRAGGANNFENLQALCKRCHSRKTALDDGRWGRGD